MNGRGRFGIGFEQSGVLKELPLMQCALANGCRENLISAEW